MGFADEFDIKYEKRKGVSYEFQVLAWAKRITELPFTKMGKITEVDWEAVVN